MYICLGFFPILLHAQENELFEEYDSEVAELREKVRQQENTLNKRQDCSSPKERKSETGVTLNIGGGVNYMYGADSFTNEKFDNDFLSWKGNILLGYTYNANEKGKGSTIGLFGTIGNTAEKSLTKIFSDGGISETLNVGEDNNRFYNVEAGVIFFEIFRASTGMGRQDYTNNIQERKNFMYYSTTLGIHIPLRGLKISLDLNQMYGRDLGKTILRPMAGLYFQL